MNKDQGKPSERIKCAEWGEPNSSRYCLNREIDSLHDRLVSAENWLEVLEQNKKDVGALEERLVSAEASIKSLEAMRAKAWHERNDEACRSDKSPTQEAPSKRAEEMIGLAKHFRPDAFKDAPKPKQDPKGFATEDSEEVKVIKELLDNNREQQGLLREQIDLLHRALQMEIDKL